MSWCLRGVTALLVGLSVMVLGGCKVLSMADYEQLMAFKTLSKDQDLKLTALIKDKERLTGELGQERKRAVDLEQAAGSHEKVATETATAVRTMGETIDDLRRRNKMMADELEKLRAGGGLSSDITVLHSPYGVGFQMKGDFLFASGRDSLKVGAQKSLDQVAAILKTRKGQVRVCGFTDTDPINKTKNIYQSNFHLSSMRALSVLNYLDKAGVDPGRMHIAGFGEHAIVHDSSGKEVKARSRRVEVWLLTGEKSAESTAGPDTSAPVPEGSEPK